MRTLSICNVVDSSLARESDGVFYTHAGPGDWRGFDESIYHPAGRALSLALHLAETREMAGHQAIKEMLEELLKVPHQVQQTLDLNPQIEVLCQKIHECPRLLILGTGSQLPDRP